MDEMDINEKRSHDIMTALCCFIRNPAPVALLMCREIIIPRCFYLY
jgi:hypothetical protein